MVSQNTMSYTSYDGFLTGLLSLLIKILIIILIVSLIIGVSLWVKNYFFHNISVTQFMNRNPITKPIVGLLAAIFILYLLVYFFSYITGNNYRYSMSMMSGYGLTFNFGGIILLLFKALTFLFVITLIISIVAYMIKQFGINDFNIFQTMNKTTEDTKMQNNKSDINIPKPAEEPDNDNI